MNIHWKCCYRVLWVGLMLIGILNCAHKPFNPPKTGEIPEGPGVFSKGDDGVVLFDSKKAKKQGAAKTPAVPAPGKSHNTPMTDGDYEEFEAFRQWQEWKKSNTGSDEYESFKQWQEWRQYQNWKKQK